MRRRIDNQVGAPAGRRVAAALAWALAGVVLSAPAPAATLVGPGVALGWSEPDGARGLQLVFAGDGLPEPTGVGCPRQLSLRIATAGFASGELALPCRGWRDDGSGRYEGVSPSGLHARLRVAPGELRVRLRGEGLPALGPDAGFLELRLRIGGRDRCGRFEPIESGRVPAWATGPVRPCSVLRERPNVLLVYLDDARADGVDRMPVLAGLAAGGLRFDSAFTPNPVCGPSRVTVLTGRHSVGHGVRANSGPIGGPDLFRESGADEQTLAVWLRAAGYRTGLFGKYLNAYADSEADQGPFGSFYVPPGWDRWWAMVSTEHYGGVHGNPYRIVEENHAVSEFADSKSDAEYATDRSAKELRDFVAASVAEGRPFFAYWAPYAPHVETPGYLPAPADRHFDAFAELPDWRPPAWNEPDVSDKPRWVRDLHGSDSEAKRARVRDRTDAMRRRAYETLLSVDEQLGETLALLAELDQERDTLVIVTSDNGVGWGEHRVFSSLKGCPYDECQRVPLIVRYPAGGAEPGLRVAERVVLNLDLAPTVAELAGADFPAKVQGLSFADLLRPGTGATESRMVRHDYLLEAWRTERGDSLRYRAAPVDGDRVRLRHGDPWATPRPVLRFEFDAGDGVAEGAIPIELAATAHGSFTRLAAAITERLPGASFRNENDELRVHGGSDESLLFEVETDAGSVLAAGHQVPDYFGVRDVESGHLYVEYESGERELYDLEADPLLLQNVAGTPRYAEAQRRLAARLRELLLRHGEIGSFPR